MKQRSLMLIYSYHPRCPKFPLAEGDREGVTSSVIKVRRIREVFVVVLLET